MEADELRLLPARQVLGFGAIGALTLVLASTIAPGRPRAFLAASVASVAASMSWLLVPLVAPPGDNTAITLIALGAAAASAWSADFLYHEWRPAQPSPSGSPPSAPPAPDGEIVELNPTAADRL